MAWRRSSWLATVLAVAVTTSLIWQSNPNLLVGLRSGGTNRPLTFSLRQRGYSAKVWQHVAASFRAATTTLTLYLNGVQVAQQALGARAAANGLPLEIGRQGPALGRYWLG